MGSWLALLGHVTGSVPVGFQSPKSTSATPRPSVPGSQAATSASQSPSWAAMSRGRPETRTTTTGTPEALSRERTARSVASRPMPPGRSPGRGGELRVGRAAKGAGPARVGEGVLEEAQLELLRGEAGVGVVEARHRYPARLHLAAQQGDEAAPVVRHHDHVESRVDGGA